MLMSSNPSETPEWGQFDCNGVTMVNSLCSARDYPKTRGRRPLSTSKNLECVKHGVCIALARLHEFTCGRRGSGSTGPAPDAAEIDNALKRRKAAIAYSVEHTMNLGVFEICRELQGSLLCKYLTVRQEHADTISFG